MSKAVEYHKAGYNCAESIIKAFNDERHTDIPVSLASPFGGGMGVGANCGAITGMVIALGAVTGRTDATEPNKAKEYARILMQIIKEKYGTYDCRELKQKGVSCDEIIAYTFALLQEKLPQLEADR